MSELGQRVSASEVGAQAVVDSPVFYNIVETLASPHPVTRGLGCRLLGLLAQYECTIPPILEMRGCEQLVALLQ
jgi:hypothetical protein